MSLYNTHERNLATEPAYTVQNPKELGMCYSSQYDYLIKPDEFEEIIVNEVRYRRRKNSEYGTVVIPDGVTHIGPTVTKKIPTSLDNKIIG